MKTNLFFIFLTILFFNTISSKERLTIFHAGSLAVPIKQMNAGFNKIYPDVEILTEAAGSRACVRKITDLGKKADLLFSADYTVIKDLMFPKFADFSINFASNEIGIMYFPHSKYSSIIDSTNWYKILLKKDVKFGHSDPNADPAGYRSQLVWQLAEKFYNQLELYSKLKNGNPVIRPKETDLLALLESSIIDYIFIYKSVALQHKGNFVTLDDQINLRSSKYSKFYSTASIKLTGKKPGEWIEKKGAPIVYGFTIPKTAINKPLALKYAQFVLSNRGREIMEENGQTTIFPPTYSGDKTKIPSLLK